MQHRQKPCGGDGKTERRPGWRGSRRGRGCCASGGGASGCSIDGLFRTLKALEPKLGASLVTSGLVFYRDPSGAIQSVDRERFSALGAEGKIGLDTPVFDPTVTTLGEWRARFELDAARSWHAGLLHDKQHA